VPVAPPQDRSPYRSDDRDHARDRTSVINGQNPNHDHSRNDLRSLMG
jgi:hypothetical protein